MTAAAEEHEAATCDEDRQGGARDANRLPPDVLKRLARFVGCGNRRGPVSSIGPEAQLGETGDEVRHRPGAKRAEDVDKMPAIAP